MKEQSEAGLEHAWNWFEFHAAQRLTIIRFYFLMIGALGAGYLTSLNSQHEFISLIIAVFAACISILFWLLDGRTSDLIKIGENALDKIEKDLAKTSGVHEITFIEIADAKNIQQPNNKRKILMNFLRKTPCLHSYGEIFFLMFFISFILFAMAALISLEKLLTSVYH